MISIFIFFADAEKRKAMLYLSSDEVSDAVSKAIDEVEDNIQVIFEDVKCEDCGVVGDKRLLPDFCHMEKMYKHPQPLQHFHPQDLQSYHPLPEENLHPGVLRLTGGPNETCETVKNVLVGMIPVVGLLRESNEAVKTGIMALAINIGYGLWFKSKWVKKMKQVFWADVLTVSTTMRIMTSLDILSENV